MCGACGAGSSRSATHHWSAPFLASVPARAAAAATLTRWSRGAGWSGLVSGVASGFEVATASGRRSLTPDLAATLDQLTAYGISPEHLLAESSRGVAEGPPTRPGRRPRGSVADPAGSRSVLADVPVVRRTLPPDPRRRYRVPGLLVLLTAADVAEALGPLTVHLGLGDSAGMVLVSGGPGDVTCDTAAAPVDDLLLVGDDAWSAPVVSVLWPTGSRA